MQWIKKLVYLVLSFGIGVANAQPVAKRVVVEHFTNTYCSICASRNPGFYNNLWQFPQVMHLSVFPSAPYSACPINQKNKVENDARTKYYGIYGETPRIVIQGKVIPNGADFKDASLFQNELNQTTPFEVNVKLTALNPDHAQVQVVVKKVATSSVTNLVLYGALVQDTLYFNANNGEAVHYNVFRKAVWANPMSIVAPANAGDSVVYTQTMNTDKAWKQIYAMAILSNAANKEAVQAGKSGILPVTTSVSESKNYSAAIYPNPVHERLFVRNVDVIQPYAIINHTGLIVRQGVLQAGALNIGTLHAGLYYLKLVSADGEQVIRFIKD